MDKSPEAFRTISEVADWLDVPTHVLRFWESRFSQVKPVKRAGGRRYYRPNDMLLIGGIKALLHDDGMTIRGVQKLLREEGVKHVSSFSKSLDGTDPAETPAAPVPAPDATPTPVVEEAETVDVLAPLDPGPPLENTELTVEPVEDAAAAQDIASEVTQVEEPSPLPDPVADPEPAPEPETASSPETPDTTDGAQEDVSAPVSEPEATPAQAEMDEDEDPPLPMFGSVRRAVQAKEVEAETPAETAAPAHAAPADQPISTPEVSAPPAPSIPATPNVPDTDPADDDPAIVTGMSVATRLRALAPDAVTDRDALRDLRERAVLLRDKLGQAAAR